MVWSFAVLLVLGVSIAAGARVRRRRQTANGDSPSTARPSVQEDIQPPGGSRPGMKPEPAPLRSCPVCLSEYPTRNRFCVRDGAELTEGCSSGPFSQGMICPTCRRGYPFDARFCPEDADELVPYGLYGAASSTRPRLMLDANKICPECGIRHAAAHLFCGQDGTQLVVVN